MVDRSHGCPSNNAETSSDILNTQQEILSVALAPCNYKPANELTETSAVETVGERIYKVRLSLGDGIRSPYPMRAFADLINSNGSGRRFELATISLLERNKQRASLDDIEAIAAVDPLKRGRSWLAFGIAGNDGAADTSLLSADTREHFYEAVRNFDLDQTRQYARVVYTTLLRRSFQRSSPGKEDDVIDEAVRLELEQFDEELSKIQNRRELIDFTIATAEFSRLLASKMANATDDEVRLFQWSAPTPGPQSLLAYESDVPGRSVSEAVSLSDGDLFLEFLTQSLPQVRAPSSEAGAVEAIQLSRDGFISMFRTVVISRAEAFGGITDVGRHAFAKAMETVEGVFELCRTKKDVALMSQSFAMIFMLAAHEVEMARGVVDRSELEDPSLQSVGEEKDLFGDLPPAAHAVRQGFIAELTRRGFLASNIDAMTRLLNGDWIRFALVREGRDEVTDKEITDVVKRLVGLLRRSSMGEGAATNEEILEALGHKPKVRKSAAKKTKRVAGK
jgi:hypothetical protein